MMATSDTSVRENPNYTILNTLSRMKTHGRIASFNLFRFIKLCSGLYIKKKKMYSAGRRYPGCDEVRLHE